MNCLGDNYLDYFYLRIIEESVLPEPKLRCSGRQGIPCRRFDIEGGEAFVAITQFI